MLLCYGAVTRNLFGRRNKGTSDDILCTRIGRENIEIDKSCMNKRL